MAKEENKKHYLDNNPFLKNLPYEERLDWYQKYWEEQNMSEEWIENWMDTNDKFLRDKVIGEDEITAEPVTEPVIKEVTSNENSQILDYLKKLSNSDLLNSDMVILLAQSLGLSKNEARGLTPITWIRTINQKINEGFTDEKFLKNLDNLGAASEFTLTPDVMATISKSPAFKALGDCQIRNAMREKISEVLKDDNPTFACKFNKDLKIIAENVSEVQQKDDIQAALANKAQQFADMFPKFKTKEDLLNELDKMEGYHGGVDSTPENLAKMSDYINKKYASFCENPDKDVENMMVTSFTTETPEIDKEIQLNAKTTNFRNIVDTLGGFLPGTEEQKNEIYDKDTPLMENTTPQEKGAVRTFIDAFGKSAFTSAKITAGMAIASNIPVVGKVAAAVILGMTIYSAVNTIKNRVQQENARAEETNQPIDVGMIIKQSAVTVVPQLAMAAIRFIPGASLTAEVARHGISPAASLARTLIANGLDSSREFDDYIKENSKTFGDTEEKTLTKKEFKTLKKQLSKEELKALKKEFKKKQPNRHEFAAALGSALGGAAGREGVHFGITSLENYQAKITQEKADARVKNDPQNQRDLHARADARERAEINQTEQQNPPTQTLSPEQQFIHDHPGTMINRDGWVVKDLGDNGDNSPLVKIDGQPMHFGTQDEHGNWTYNSRSVFTNEAGMHARGEDIHGNTWHEPVHTQPAPHVQAQSTPTHTQIHTKHTTNAPNPAPIHVEHAQPAPTPIHTEQSTPAPAPTNTEQTITNPAPTHIEQQAPVTAPAQPSSTHTQTQPPSNVIHNKNFGDLHRPEPESPKSGVALDPKPATEVLRADQHMTQYSPADQQLRPDTTTQFQQATMNPIAAENPHHIEPTNHTTPSGTVVTEHGVYSNQKTYDTVNKLIQNDDQNQTQQTPQTTYHSTTEHTADGGTKTTTVFSLPKIPPTKMQEFRDEAAAKSGTVSGVNYNRELNSLMTAYAKENAVPDKEMGD